MPCDHDAQCNDKGAFIVEEVTSTDRTRTAGGGAADAGTAGAGAEAGAGAGGTRGSPNTNGSDGRVNSDNDYPWQNARGSPQFKAILLAREEELRGKEGDVEEWTVVVKAVVALRKAGQEGEACEDGAAAAAAAADSGAVGSSDGMDPAEQQLLEDMLVTLLVDLKDVGIGTVRKFGPSDIKRGINMWADRYPVKLRYRLTSLESPVCFAVLNAFLCWFFFFPMGLWPPLTFYTVLSYTYFL